MIKYVFFQYLEAHMMFPYSGLLQIQSPSTTFSVDLTLFPLSLSMLDIFVFCCTFFLSHTKNPD